MLRWKLLIIKEHESIISRFLVYHAFFFVFEFIHFFLLRSLFLSWCNPEHIMSTQQYTQGCMSLEGSARWTQLRRLQLYGKSGLGLLYFFLWNPRQKMAVCNAKHVRCKLAYKQVLDEPDFQRMSRWVFQLVYTESNKSSSAAYG